MMKFVVLFAEMTGTGIEIVVIVIVQMIEERVLVWLRLIRLGQTLHTNSQDDYSQQVAHAGMPVADMVWSGKRARSDR